MQHSRFFVSGLILACALHVRCSLGRGLSTPEERAKVIALTRSLEVDPLRAGSSAQRDWLRRWVIDVPEIKIYWCEALLGHGLGERYPYLSEVNLQAMFAAATFAIEHPAQARHAEAQYHAGVQGALRVYEALMKSRPDATSAFLNQLLAERDRGGLIDRVRRLRHDECPRAHDALIANAAGAGVALGLALLIAGSSGAEGVRRSRRFSIDIDARLAAVCRRIVFACAAYYVIAVIALHILDPEFDPRLRFLSEYALGPHGWLMTTTFFVLGFAAFVVAVALRGALHASRSARVGFGLLTVAALFVSLAGVFKDSLPHLAAGVVAFPSIVMALFVFSWSFRQASGWRTMHAVSFVIALGALATFVGLNSAVASPGLHQRGFILLFVLWLTLVIHRCVQCDPSESAAAAAART